MIKLTKQLLLAYEEVLDYDEIEASKHIIAFTKKLPDGKYKFFAPPKDSYKIVEITGSKKNIAKNVIEILEDFSKKKLIPVYAEYSKDKFGFKNPIKIKGIVPKEFLTKNYKGAIVDYDDTEKIVMRTKNLQFKQGQPTRAHVKLPTPANMINLFNIELPEILEKKKLGSDHGKPLTKEMLHKLYHAYLKANTMPEQYEKMTHWVLPKNIEYKWSGK